MIMSDFFLDTCFFGKNYIKVVVTILCTISIQFSRSFFTKLGIVYDKSVIIRWIHSMNFIVDNCPLVFVWLLSDSKPTLLVMFFVFPSAQLPSLIKTICIVYLVTIYLFFAKKNLFLLITL